jgi:hypothetical protein
MVPEFGVQPAAHCSVRSYDISLSWDLLSVQASTDVDDGGLTTFDVDLPSEYMTFELPCQAGDLPVVRRRGPDLYWGATLRVPKEGTVGEWDIDMDVYSEYEGYFRAPGRCRLVDGARLECGIVEEGVDGELYMEGTFAFRRVGDDRKAVACDELLEWCLMHGGASL